MNKMTPDAEQQSKPAIGHRLQLTRQSFGLNQTEFAERAGISRTAYTQYEGGGKRPSINNAISLCKTFNLTLDWIYRGDMRGLTYETATCIKALQTARSQ